MRLLCGKSQKMWPSPVKLIGSAALVDNTCHVDGYHVDTTFKSHDWLFIHHRWCTPYGQHHRVSTLLVKFKCLEIKRNRIEMNLRLIQLLIKTAKQHGSMRDYHQLYLQFIRIKVWFAQFPTDRVFIVYNKVLV